MVRTVLRLALLGACTPALAQTPPPSRADTQTADPAAKLPAARSRSAARALSLRLAEVRYSDSPLERVLEDVARLAQVNLVVRWDELERLGIERDKPISIEVRNVRLGQLLWLVMNEAAAPDVKLAYRADDAFITITSAQEIEREMIVRIYDVNDLLASRLRRPTFGAVRQHTYVAGNQVAVAEGAVGSRPITGQVTSGVILEGEDAGGEDEDDRVGREAHMRQLIDVITTTVEPDSWAVNGGEGSIAAWRGLLVVRNTPLVHQALGGAMVD